MAIQSGTHLGPYEILSAIGAGGMGEIYRARDPKLGRDVAIKVLPEAFARDAERMARFQREAKVLASLSHPNIATIYGLEDSGPTRALVMELVEGPTLADRVRQGPIPVDEAVRIARQIADALEYAHERGIVHRDLKPANVKVTSEDAVKVLDFGLAKAIQGEASETDIANSPTVSHLATQAGVLLGTAAYMSPEHAKGKAVDRRADIWAFGCVLYEMLTGKMTFRGATVTETLAAVLKNEPDWSQLPAATSMRVRVLLQRCLQKDAKQRLRDIGDARISLDEVVSGAPDPTSIAPSATTRQRLWLVSGIAGFFVLATALLAFLYFHKTPPAGQAIRFEISLPENLKGGGAFRVSPDGSKLAFIAAGEDGQHRLWVRSLDTVDAHPLEGTEGALMYPAWSPDSRSIAFWADGKINRIGASGGSPQTICNAPQLIFGVWTRDGKLIFGSNDGIMQVAASGGSPFLITVRDSASPSLLPDGRHFVYLQETEDRKGHGIYVASLDTKPEAQPPKKLLDDFTAVVYTPSPDPAVGYLLFVRGAMGVGALGTLMAQPFDTRRLELTGDPVPLAENVSNNGFSASATGVLVYMARGSPGVEGRGAEINGVRGHMAWFDRDGKILGTFGAEGNYRTVTLSPDGKQVAFERADPKNTDVHNIWLYDFPRGATTRFTFDSAWDSNPVWSPDGSHIAFGSDRGGKFDLYQRLSDLSGEDESLFKSSESKLPSSWSPDGRGLLYYSLGRPTQLGLLSVGLGRGDRKPIPVGQSEFNQAGGSFSPDGRRIAYLSDESGRNEIYVQSFNVSSASSSSSALGVRLGGKRIVSKDGATISIPRWRRDGKELFYLALDGRAMAVDVSTTGGFQVGIPKALFKVPTGVLFWDVSSDGKRFVMAAPSAPNATAAQPPFTVVLNWQAALKK